MSVDVTASPNTYGEELSCEVVSPLLLEQVKTFAEASFTNFSHPTRKLYYSYISKIVSILQGLHAHPAILAAAYLYRIPSVTSVMFDELEKHWKAQSEVLQLVTQLLSLEKLEWDIQPLFLEGQEQQKDVLHIEQEALNEVSSLQSMYLLALDDTQRELHISRSMISFQKKEKQLENLIQMFLAVNPDFRALTIKLAERLAFIEHLLTSTQPRHEVNCRLFAKITLFIYAPLAERIGQWQLKSWLEDAAFHFLCPEEFTSIQQQLAMMESERDSYIKQQIIPELEDMLTSFGIQADISGRAKHIYSIYRKMNAKQLSFEQINDLLAVRIIVKTKQDCYDVQALLHETWEPVLSFYEGKAGRDWIARPKDNLYQSLHTTIRIHNKFVEVQIRTYDMHEMAEHGLTSAHYMYKTEKAYRKGKVSNIWRETSSVLYRKLVKGNLTLTEDLLTQKSLRIFVVTPQGHIIDLSVGATPLDLAYRIHTGLGHHYVGAKVGGRLVKTDYELRNGDFVELLTSRTRSGPNPAWLSKARDDSGEMRYIYARTNQARTKIRHWLHQHQPKQES